MGDLDEIKDRLTRLETQTEERWNAHDKRSSENWAALKLELGEIRESFNDLSQKFVEFCQASALKKEQCMKEAREFTERHCNKAIGLALGIPAAIITVIELVKILHK